LLSVFSDRSADAAKTADLPVSGPVGRQGGELGVEGHTQAKSYVLGPPYSHWINHRTINQATEWAREK